MIFCQKSSAAAPNNMWKHRRQTMKTKKNTKNVKNAAKSTLSSLIAIILSFAVSIMANTAMAHGIHNPSRSHHSHHYANHCGQRGRVVLSPFTAICGKPIVQVCRPRAFCVWIPGFWVEERDIYGRLIGRRWIPGRWEYR